MQLNIVRKDSAPSGQEELRAESITVTVKDGAEEPSATKPGVDALGRLGETRLLTSVSGIANLLCLPVSQERSC